MGLLLVNLNRKLREKLAEATWKLGNHLIALFEDRGKLKKEKQKPATCVLLCSAAVDPCRQKVTRISLLDSVRTTQYHVPCTT